MIERQPDTIIHLGAGRCSEFAEYDASSPRRIILVEADPDNARFLRTVHDQDKRVRVVERAMLSSPGIAILRVLNIRRLSSVREPVGLRELYPGLRQEAATEVSVITLQELVQTVRIVAGSENWLVVDTPGTELDVFDDLLKRQLHPLFPVVRLRLCNTQLFDGALPLDTALERIGQSSYEILGRRPVSPERTEWFLRRDVARIQINKTDRLAETLSRELSMQRNVLSAQEELNRSVVSEIAALREDTKAHHQLLDGLSAQLSELRLLYTNRLSELEMHRADYDRCEDREADSRARFETMESMLSGLKRAIRKRHDQLERRVVTSLRDAQKQLESYMAIETFLATGDIMPVLSDWSIAPDLAIRLIGMVSRNDYDLIIEFGSGSSTALLAMTALQKKVGTPIHSTAVRRHDSLGGQSACMPMDDLSSRPDMKTPQRRGAIDQREIISFEHSSKYLADTTRLLADLCVADLVQLVHAPLQDCTCPDGGSYLYYACDDVLRAAERDDHSSPNSLLVLVDGPPGSTGKNARYPALPKVLEHLGGSDIDIVLDDAARSDEREIVRMWTQELDRRELSWTMEELKVSKGGIVISIRA